MTKPPKDELREPWSMTIKGIVLEIGGYLLLIALFAVLATLLGSEFQGWL